MEAQNAHDIRGIGKRIRFLRGDLSQTEFATIIGVSRAALANYETGRTKPNNEIILSIANACDVFSEFITSGDVRNIEEFAVTLGIGPNATDSLTVDEWAVVRILGVCDDATIQATLSTLVTGFAENKAAKELADKDTVLMDLARLIQIVDAGTGYQRSFRKGNLDSVLEALRKRVKKLSE